ncbi:MAG TPA: prepilin-type N-terminal cleavage/methylation domain-containing protein [candidate division WOR-3 bacterium]|uniref:Prepilin-type N-terminal cleavage/methylation domain-containing protein n=1 Tax=candidate division WOR-3 bacterium TaxID=2052148 RepID=A0A7V0XEV6_UNCW3|nr:prepilin-type N-terminal cleavage/methylation domain-containing protein [candidate division WOR-3 bacterium]
MNTRRISRGVTLLELLVVMMVLSLILTAAVKTWDVTLERSRFETTRRKLNQISEVIVGNPDYIVSGNRVDFGYVGDVGALPQVLDDLVRRPVGFPESGTWRGPYIRSTFSESPTGYRTDGWGDSLIYNTDSLFLRSYGGRGLVEQDRWLTRTLGYTRDALLNNTVSGVVLDVRGIPPPNEIFNGVDVRVEFSGPQGGLMQDFPVFLLNDGQFEITNVPQGNLHELRAVFKFVRPPLDSVEARKTITVYPGRGARDIQLRLNTDWTAP